jgi:hypothetical protein
MPVDRFAFNRGAIRPFQCLTEGWHLIKQEYWFFLGVTLVGALVAGMAPFGILMGPAYCGIHICLLRHANGQRIAFDMLFQGFNYFGQSLIATMFMMVPIMFMMGIYFVGYLGGIIGIAAMAGQNNQQPDPVLMFSWIIGWTLAFVIVATFFEMFFFFVYPLIVDRELTGVEAVKVSYRAVMGNFGGVIMILLLEFVLTLIGLLACYVGAIFVLPINFAMMMVAYRQVFPLIDPYADEELETESPAPKLIHDTTAAQSMEPRPTSVQEMPPESPPPQPAS